MVIRARGVGQVREFQGKVEIHFVLSDGIRVREVLEHTFRPVPGNDDVGQVSGFLLNRAGSEDAEPFFLPEINGPVGSFLGTVLAESHGFQPVPQAETGHLPGLRVKAGETVLCRNPQVITVQQEALDLVVRQPVLLRIKGQFRFFGLVVVQPAEAVPICAGPEGVPVRDQRHADGHLRDLSGLQRFQVDGTQPVETAYPQFVRGDAGPEAGCRLPGIPGKGCIAQIIDIQPVVGGDPNIVVDGIVRHSENDIDASGRFRLMPLRVVDDFGAGRIDIVQASGHGSEPDPALPVLTECSDRIVGEGGVLRVVIAEYQVSDLPAQAVSGRRQPQDAPVVDVHRPDRCRRDGGGRALYV